MMNVPSEPKYTWQYWRNRFKKKTVAVTTISLLALTVGAAFQNCGSFKSLPLSASQQSSTNPNGNPTPGPTGPFYINITSTPINPQFALNPTFFFNADPNKSGTLICVFDGAPVTPCVSPLTLTNLSVGNHSLTITENYADGTSTYSNFSWSYSTPKLPEVASLAGGAAYDVIANNNMLYVLSGTAGIKIYDITKPTAPVLLGSTLINGFQNSVAKVYHGTVSGNYLYFSTDQGFGVVDVSIPTLPHQVALANVNNGCLYPLNISVIGHYANCGAQLYDISSPSNPSYAGKFAVSSQSQQFFAIGKYFIGQVGSGANAIDPTNSAQVLTVNIDLSAPGAMIVYADSNRLVTIDNTNNFTFYSMGDPLNPIKTATLANLSGVGVYGFALANNHLYCGRTVNPKSYITSINIADLTKPFFETMTLPFNGDSILDVRMASANGYYYYNGVDPQNVYDYQASAVQVSDLSTTDANGNLTSTNFLSATPAHINEVVTVGPTQVAFIDYANPHYDVFIADTANSTINVIAKLGLSGVDHIYSSGKYLYVTGTQLLVYDMTIPAQPKLVSSTSFSPANDGRAIFSGSYLYLQRGVGVQIYDVSDPANIVAGTTISNVYIAGANGNTFFGITNGYKTLNTYNVTSATSAPALLGSVTVPLMAYGGVYSNGFVYLGGTQLQVVDATNLSNPKLVANATQGINVVGPEHIMRAVGNRLLLFAQTNMYYPEGTLYAYDITNPTVPAPVVGQNHDLSIGLYLNNPRYQSIAIVGNQIVFAAGDQGLKLLNMP